MRDVTAVLGELSVAVVVPGVCRRGSRGSDCQSFLFRLDPTEGRNVLDDPQSGEIEKPEVDIEDATVPGGPSGKVISPTLRRWTWLGGSTAGFTNVAIASFHARAPSRRGAAPITTGV
jgi:hypothetical protein